MRLALRHAVRRHSRSRLARSRVPDPSIERVEILMSAPASRIRIIDYGSQFTQLIARRVREARVYSEIHPPTKSLEWIRAWKPTGIILSGGPNSVTDEGAPDFDKG